MALFCSAIRKYSVFLIRFPLFRYVQAFSCEIFLVSCWKLSQICFSSHFSFFIIVVLLVLVLFVLFLVVVISLSLIFLMLVSPLAPFLDTYSLTISSVECTASCLVISFIFLWSICRFGLVSLFNHIHPTPPLGQDMTQDQFLIGV